MGDVPPHAFEGRSDQLRTEGVSWTDPIQGRPINLHSAPTLRRESHHQRRGLRLARGHMSSISGDRFSHTSRCIRRGGRRKGTGLVRGRPPAPDQSDQAAGLRSQRWRRSSAITPAGKDVPELAPVLARTWPVLRIPGITVDTVAF